MEKSPLFNPGIPTYVAPVVEETPVEVNTEVTEQPVVETPIDAPIIEPVVETPPIETPPTPTEAIREVEKIVEKYPEMDEYTGEIFQALLDGKEDVLLNYLSERSRDYKTMSDYDVVLNNLLKTNPHYSREDAELKLEMQYGEIAKIDLSKLDADADPVKYAQAEEHNAQADRAQKMLRLDAIEARANLEAAKKEIKLPKIATPVVAESNQPTAEQIEQGRKIWQDAVAAEIPTLKELTFKVGSEADGYEDVSYAITDKERADELAFFNDLNMPKMLSRLGWVDANGKQNVAKMVGDVLKLERANQLVASAYTQGRVAGTKTTVAEIKNIDLNTNNSSSVASTPEDIGLKAWGHLNPK